jgi:type II secretory pathway pseudopilin PulG
MKSAARAPSVQLGFTYVGLLLFVAILGLVSATTVRIGVAAQRRVSEQELLERGHRLAQALESYSRATPTGKSTYPRLIDDLLRDPRFPKTVVRHLRRIEPDPMTGRAEWGTVPSEDGSGIAGFHSLSDQRVWRQDFAPPFNDFADKPLYRDWVFEAGLGG